MCFDARYIKSANQFTIFSMAQKYMHSLKSHNINDVVGNITLLEERSFYTKLIDSVVQSQKYDLYIFRAEVIFMKSMPPAKD